jgi:Na+/H+ antiporter NhaD/arsenite permease-like protein
VGKVPFQTWSSVIGISAFVLVVSQLLGNVALIQLAKPNIEYLEPESKRFAWALLSFIATIGGNLTITGSAGIDPKSIFVLINI